MEWAALIALLALLLYLALKYFGKKTASGGAGTGTFTPYPNPGTAATGHSWSLGKWSAPPPSLLVNTNRYTLTWSCFTHDITAAVGSTDTPRAGVTVDFFLQGNPDVIFLAQPGDTATIASDRLASGVTDARGEITMTILAQGGSIDPGSITGVERTSGQGAEARFEVRRP